MLTIRIQSLIHEGRMDKGEYKDYLKESIVIRSVNKFKYTKVDNDLHEIECDDYTFYMGNVYHKNERFSICTGVIVENVIGIELETYFVDKNHEECLDIMQKISDMKYNTSQD